MSDSQSPIVRATQLSGALTAILASLTPLARTAEALEGLGRNREADFARALLDGAQQLAIKLAANPGDVDVPPPPAVEAPPAPPMREPTPEGEPPPAVER